MFVTAIGMACPVGLSAASACAAQRAGISAMEELPWFDNDREPIIGAMVPGLDWRLPRVDRLLGMLLLAIDDLLESHGQAPWDQIPLFVCVAEPDRPGGGGRGELAQALVDALLDRRGIRFHAGLSRVLPCGHTGGFRALREVRQLLARSDAPACMVCGVDSFLQAPTLGWLDRHHRLKTPANRDGVMPGEAAAVVLLEPRATPGAVVEVSGLGFATEDASILSEKPLLGHGLTQAARSALAEARLGLHEVDLRLSDVTGELYGFKELPLMEGRLMRVVRKQAQPLWHWAETIGDSGAAAGVAQLVLADQAFRKDYAPGPHALALCASPDGDRAAAVLRQTRA